MAARHPISGTAHSYLNAFAELLRKYPAERAVAKFSKLIKNRKLDIVSANALCFVTRQAGGKKLGEEMLSRVHRTKHMLNSCTAQLSGVALRTLRNKTVVAHPISHVTAPMLKSAKKVCFISANKGSLHSIPSTVIEAHKPLTAHIAIEGADFVLLEPKAISSKGVFVETGGRLLSELAKARGIPIYALTTSWHTVPDRRLARNEERIPPEMISAVVSEHGVHAFRVFLNNVKKSCPWIARAA